MSLATVAHLYSDVEKLAVKHPGLSASPEAVKSFNDDLAAAKKQYPDNPELAAMSEANSRIRLEGFLIIVGRLKAILESQQSPLLGSL